MAHFLAMGGYAAYVWPAYAASVIALAAVAAWTLAAHRRARRRLAEVESARP